VAADDAASIDDALVSGCDKSAAEGEVVGGRQSPRECRGALEVGEEHRRWSPRGLGDALHPREVLQVAAGGDGRQDRHASERFDDERGAGQLARRVAHPQGRHQAAQ